MKKYENYLPALIAGLGAAAAALRLWINAAVDENGLYLPAPLPRVLLLIVTLAAAGASIYVCMRLKESRKYAFCFPASVVGAIGMAIGAACVGISSVSGLLDRPDGLGLMASLLGLAAVAALGLMALLRYRGQRPNMLLPALVCVFLIFRVLDGFRSWSFVPQVDVYLFQLLASVCLLLASYLDTAFCCGKGQRRWQLLTHLAALFFGIGALPGCTDPLFYLGCAIWMGTNTCVIRRKK